MMSQTTQENIPEIFGVFVIAVMGYLVYALLVPNFFFEDRIADVKCPIVWAATVTTKEDSGGVPNPRSVNSRRNVLVSCDFRAVGAPEPKYGPNLDAYLSEVATKQPSITVGDTFACPVTWRTFADLPLAAPLEPRGARLDPKSCRFMPRT